MPSNTRISRLPSELTQQIASYCGYREQRDLAYTCRSLFASVAPVIWKDVQGIETIMKLIPGVKITTSYSFDEGDAEISKDMIFDESLVTGDWTRYWSYAPFIQHITPFSSSQGDMDGTLHVWGWHYLFTKLKGSVLLPNLRSLNAKEMYLSPQLDRLAWLALLISTSVQELDLEDVRLSLDDNPPSIRALSLLLDAISKSSSNNSSRSPVPQNKWHPSEQTLASLFPVEYSRGSSWFSNIPAPIGLRCLKVTLLSPTALWDEICIIGSLPLLESLEISFHLHSFSSEVEYNLEEIPLPLGSFPSLHRLELRGASNVRLFCWVWGLKPMVSGLSSAHINAPDFGSNRQSMAMNFSQLIRDNSPNLTDLSILMHPSGMGALEVACELASVIPLTSLEFSLFTGVVGDLPATHYNRTFPHLRRLNIFPTFRSPDYATLPKIAKVFPNLEQLHMSSSVELESYKPLSMNCINHMGFEPIEIQILISCSGSGPTRDEEKWISVRDNIEKFLRAVWPNASVTIDSCYSYTIVHPADNPTYSLNTTSQNYPTQVPDERQTPREVPTHLPWLFILFLAWLFGAFRF